jgi:hypothetical protein
MPWPNLGLTNWTQAGRTVTQHDTKKTWFSGEFIYRFPAVDASPVRKLRANARQLLGFDLSPETLWNAAPWTWLTDWVANTGDVLANVSAISEDDLVMRYGYLMQEATRRYVHVHRGVRPNYAAMVIPSTITGETSYTVKSRIGASPYGFGLTFTNFSGRQLAILAALGITRSGRA